MVNLITEHIDIWTATQTQKTNGGRGRGKNSNGQSQHGIKKLRELILELAVRGKLVPQDPNDEPARVLLKKIAQEKVRLIEEKEIKKRNKLPEVTEGEKPFELPEGWEWERLGNIAEIIRGVTYKKHDAQDNSFEGGIALMRANNIGYTLNFDNLVYIPKNLVKEAQIIITGDLLIAMSSGSPDLVGKAAQVDSDIDSTFGAFCGVIRATSNDLWNYFGFFFKTPIYRDQATKSGKGIGINNLNKGSLENLLVALPPLSEQLRIVAKVDELMALCDQLEQQQTDSNATHQTLVETLLTTLTNASDEGEFAEAWQRIANHFDTLFTTEHNIDQLKQTILQLAVMGKLVPQDSNDELASELLEKIAEEKARLIKEGRIKKQKPLPEITDEEKPFELPASWEWTYVGECFSLMSGTSFNKKKELERGQYIYIKVADMNLEGNEVEITTSSRFLDPTPKELNALIPAGSIIFPKRGGAIATNKKRFVKNDLFVDLNIMAITPFEGINLDYAYRWLMGIDLAKLNSGTSVPQINNKDISPLLFPIPPLNEQHRIVAKVDELMALCDTLKTRLNDAQTTQVQLADVIVEQAVA